MVAYVSKPQLKEKWSQVKDFLIAHRYRSWDDAYLYLSFKRATEAFPMGQASIVEGRFN